MRCTVTFVAGALLVLALVPGQASAQTLATLASFNGANGASPYGSLTLSGSTLYGMTYFGGTNGYGTIFKIGTDGNGYSVLHSFGSGSDGFEPGGDLTLIGSTLYGMTGHGGSYGTNADNGGTIFKIGTDGSGYSILHSFGSGSDGMHPDGDLTLTGSTLYGMTGEGGSHGYGTIFKVGMDGSAYSIVRSFASGPGDGAWPWGSLTLDGSTLYGMTSGTAFSGGVGGTGTIFKIGTNGVSYSILHSFLDGSGDGAWPYGSLTLDGSTLYGMTVGGGTHGVGTIFKIGTDGSAYNILHSFALLSDGGDPWFGSMTLNGSTLYGMTYRGGSSGNNGDGYGTIFKIGTDGSGYSVLHPFSDGSDGAYPAGSLTLSGSTLYGMTNGGGAYNKGVIFSLTIPEPSTFALLGIGSAALLAWGWWRRRLGGTSLSPSEGRGLSMIQSRCRERSILRP